MSLGTPVKDLVKSTKRSDLFISNFKKDHYDNYQVNAGYPYQNYQRNSALSRESFCTIIEPAAWCLPLHFLGIIHKSCRN